MQEDLKTYKDLCEVDDLEYWKLYENMFIELTPSSMVSIPEEDQMKLILRFYFQSLLNKAYALTDNQKLRELYFITKIKEDQFDWKEAIDIVTKYLDQAVEERAEKANFQAL